MKAKLQIKSYDGKSADASAIQGLVSQSLFLSLFHWTPFYRRYSYIFVCLNKMASQTHGIQQLLAAEKKAADKVAEARKRKSF